VQLFGRDLHPRSFVRQGGWLRHLVPVMEHLQDQQVFLRPEQNQLFASVQDDLGDAEKKPTLICIGSLPPGGFAHTRYLCKRLRTRLPKTKIIVGRWGLKGNLEANHEQLTEAGADHVETTLISPRRHRLQPRSSAGSVHARIRIAPSPLRRVMSYSPTRIRNLSG
jgi:hypothetical protein